MRFKLSKLSFRAGSYPDQVGTSVTDLEVVLLVGPNNSGKSLALREIENWCIGKNPTTKVVDVDRLGVLMPDTAEEAIEFLQQFKTKPPPNQPIGDGEIWIAFPTFRPGEPVHQERFNPNFFSMLFNSHDPQRQEACKQLTRILTVRLDGRARFALSDPQPAGDLQSQPQNHLWTLFRNDEAREKVRALTRDAFGLYFVIDPTAMTQFRVRMSSRPPETKAEEQALDNNARAFHQGATLITELGDGIQTFTGLVSAVLSLPYQILLIDEPEAYLHPPLARRLGQNLCNLTKDRRASLIVATHSADFVMGCIESGANVQILRFTFENPRATTRLLDAIELKKLMNDPLLRSTQALRGLFHKAVVVTESDKDRAFYEEINYRLQVEGRGISDALFMNAQNWQTISRVVRPLRVLGIPAAAIMDLDVLEQEEQSWESIYDVFAVDASTRTRIEQCRQRVSQGLHTTPNMHDVNDKRKCYKLNGIAAIPREYQTNVCTLIKELAEYGLFIVPVGEVESWFARDGVSHDSKRDWLPRVFSYMGSDPSSPEYIRPCDDGVWRFIDAVGQWITNPDRSGSAFLNSGTSG